MSWMTPELRAEIDRLNAAAAAAAVIYDEDGVPMVIHGPCAVTFAPETEEEVDAP